MKNGKRQLRRVGKKERKQKKEQQKIKELTIKEKIITKDNKGKQVKDEYEQGHPRR